MIDAELIKKFIGCFIEIQRAETELSKIHTQLAHHHLAISNAIFKLLEERMMSGGGGPERVN